MLTNTDILSNADFRFFDSVADLGDYYCIELTKEFEAEKLSPLQKAVQEIATPAFSEVFSIRELLKLHYLHTSDLLLRPLLERVATISYIRKSDESVLRLWESNWNGKNGPSTKTRIDHMDELRNPFTGVEIELDKPYRDIVNDYRVGLHSLVHGDRHGSYRNVAIGSDGRKYFPAGPNPHNPEASARIAKVAATLTSYLLQEINVVFPKIEQHMLGKQP